MRPRRQKRQLYYLKRSIALIISGLVLSSCTLKNEKTNPRPNIIVILSDDMGFSDLGCYGGEIETPNLDRLAENGLRFTEFYGTARCWPTRATLMSGRYSDRLSSSQVTIAELLKTVDYQTSLTGKWHLSKTATDNGPIQRGFDSYYGAIVGGGSYWRPPGLTRNTQAVEPDSPDYYYTEKIGDEAVKQIQVFAQSPKPFFQYVAFTSPHWPLHAREEVIQKYLKRYQTGWPALRQNRYQRMIKMGLIDENRWPLPDPEPGVQDWDSVDHKEWRVRNMAVYAAMIDHMDQAIGRIVGALKATGQLENTLIIFTNDNGACSEHLSGNAWGTADNVLEWAKTQGKTISMGDEMEVETGGPLTFHSVGRNWANAQNTPLRRYKANVHEGGACVPCIMHWPDGMKQAAGSITRQRGHMVDILSTCIELAGVSYPGDFNGNSILPNEGTSLVKVIQGGNQDPQRTYYFNHQGTHAIIKGDWKIVRETYGDNTWHLYNLTREKTEITDHARSKPEKVTELAALWEARFGEK
ncbi:MAG: arylsulfatase [Bacteroidetes bacterium]|nr:arylsulfatase [Bacteroidota bacterium]